MADWTILNHGTNFSCPGTSVKRNRDTEGARRYRDSIRSATQRSHIVRRGTCTPEDNCGPRAGMPDPDWRPTFAPDLTMFEAALLLKPCRMLAGCK